MTTNLTGITLRQAEETDLPQVVNLDRLAFAPLRSPAEIERDWYGQGLNLPGRQHMLAVDDLNGQAVATYAQLDLSVVLEGQGFTTAGVAGVAVAPERRGQRIARFMLEQGVQEWRSQQIPLAMLYPFQHGFYRQLGWAWVGRLHQYTVAAKHLPLYPERFGMVPYDPKHHQPALQDAYQRSALRRNGWLQRQELQWQPRLKPEPGKEIYCYQEAGKLLGYIILQYAAVDSLPGTLSVVVQEWVALNADAYRGILGFLSALRDQVHTVVWNTYPEDPFPYLVREQHRVLEVNQAPRLYGFTHRFGEIGGGFMWRLVDLTTAFRLRPVKQGSPFILTFQVSDPILGDQTITANFTAERMHPVAQPVPAVLKTSVEHLTELFCGLRRATEMVWTREIEYEGDRALLQKLDAAWQCTPPFCWDYF
ncbi:enhanced intracellular survival protein Eis [Trichocoleus sp. FACHB-262]|uniref:GNAT family N-acetyltransferase n=1 Tax=Trichocoleus sp. FACHB-262 TaxID=2692869 RepID=UPI001682249C|nr:GNAT family N-acetyltransferase [Trichocoleus sp. FACHB-262]MBD2122063.1 GNAT family N-acetyltransferase [Trichocoleus sp. FACHB-262]